MCARNGVRTRTGRACAVTRDTSLYAHPPFRQALRFELLTEFEIDDDEHLYAATTKSFRMSARCAPGERQLVCAPSDNRLGTSAMSTRQFR